jgi:hypothetical protein
MTTDTQLSDFIAYAQGVTKPHPTTRKIVHRGSLSGESTVRVALLRIEGDRVLVQVLAGRPFDISDVSDLQDADIRPDTHAQFVYWSNMRWVTPEQLLADRPELEEIAIPLNVNTFERTNA